MDTTCSGCSAQNVKTKRFQDDNLCKYCMNSFKPHDADSIQTAAWFNILESSLLKAIKER